MIQSVLFVCLGNICRSPAAEALFQVHPDRNGLRHDSAGTSGWHIGNPPYGPMASAAGARGVAMDHLRARKFVAEDFDRFDLILGMDADNLSAIESLRPAGNATRTGLLMDFAQPDQAPGWTGDIPDPYYTRDFDGALDMIEAGVAGLVGHIRSSRGD